MRTWMLLAALMLPPAGGAPPPPPLPAAKARPAAAVAAPLFTPGRTIRVNALGWARYYQTPGLMEAVAWGHNHLPPLPPGVRYYASSPYVRLGMAGHPRYGQVRVRAHGVLYEFWVMFGDESQTADRARQIAHDLVIELPYQAAHAEGWWQGGKADARLVRVTP